MLDASEMEMKRLIPAFKDRLSGGQTDKGVISVSDDKSTNRGVYAGQWEPAVGSIFICPQEDSLSKLLDNE